MKTIILFFVVVIGSMIYLHQSLQNGTILRFIDEYPHSQYAPQATYVIGQGYYLFQDLPEAATYFWRITQRYPKNALGDDAAFSYLQCLDDMASVSRSELVDGYRTYLENYPDGKHAEIAKARQNTYQSSSH